MEDWENVQTIINNIGNITKQLSGEDRKLIIRWKLQIFGSMIKALNTAKSQTKHSHIH
jgi:hypothetical protein